MVGPENSIFRKLKSVDPKKIPLTTEIDLHFYFPFKAFPENERERERKSARACKRRSVECDLAVDRDLDSARSREGEITINGAISRRRDCVRRFTRLRRRSRSREIKIAIDDVISRRRNLYLHKIAIDGTISRSVDRDLGLLSSNWSSRDQRGLELGVRRRSSD